MRQMYYGEHQCGRDRQVVIVVVYIMRILRVCVFKDLSKFKCTVYTLKVLKQLIGWSKTLVSSLTIVFGTWYFIEYFCLFEPWV